jgi:hypothetical protein
MANALRMRERFPHLLGSTLQWPTDLEAMADQMVGIALDGITTNEARGGN